MKMGLERISVAPDYYVVHSTNHVAEQTLYMLIDIYSSKPG